MRHAVRVSPLFVAFFVAAVVFCLAAAEKELSPAAKASLAKQAQVVEGWAASPEIVAAVKEQNAKGPLDGMDNEKWKAVKRSDPIVKAFQDCAAGKFLADKLGASKGLFGEAFLSAAKGEKVAFVSKTTSYIHKGKAKFDDPMSGKVYEGALEFDESTQSYSVQIGVPVMDGGKPIGVLVVGVNAGSL